MPTTPDDAPRDALSRADKLLLQAVHHADGPLGPPELCVATGQGPETVAARARGLVDAGYLAVDATPADGPGPADGGPGEDDGPTPVSSPDAEPPAPRYALTDDGHEAAAAVDRARAGPVDDRESVARPGDGDASASSGDDPGRRPGVVRETQRELADLFGEIEATTDEGDERVRACARVAEAVYLAGTAAASLQGVSAGVGGDVDPDEFVREFVRQYRESEFPE